MARSKESVCLFTCAEFVRGIDFKTYHDTRTVIGQKEEPNRNCGEICCHLYGVCRDIDNKHIYYFHHGIW